MKTKSLILTAIFTIVFCAGTGIAKSTVFASVHKVNDEIEVNSFSEVGISISSTVYIEQGKNHKLVIDAPDDLLELIEVKVENGKLLIMPETYGSDLKGDIKIFITSPDFDEISLSGSVKLFAEKRIESGEIELKISGSGEMNFNELLAEETELKISGSGKAVLNGKAEETDITIAGSGSVDAGNLRTSEAEVRISGSGRCIVFADNELDVSIAGSGKVSYRGSAEVNSKVAGSGSVTKL